MKQFMKTLFVISLVVVGLFIAVPAMANTMLTGEVGSANDIIADDGNVYTIAETEKGDELSAMVGETVNVTGTVQEVDGEKVITIDSFTVVNK